MYMRCEKGVNGLGCPLKSQQSLAYTSIPFLIALGKDTQ